MNAIVAVDENWAIGKDNNLLFHISEDLKRFKRLTEDKIVIMGRKTFESLPNKKPLPNRINYIMTRDLTYKVDGAIVVHSCTDLIFHLLNDGHLISNDKNDNVFVIGGSEIYELLYEYIQYTYVTKVYTKVEKVDKYFIDLSKDKNCKLIDKSEKFKDEKTDLEYDYELYYNPYTIK